MKMKVMLGLAAVSLLASCGNIKTDKIAIGTDTTKSVVAGSNVGGGALGIDGKGAPLSLSKDRVLVQGLNENKVLADGTFEDDKTPDTVNNIGRLSEWGATQVMPLATLTPKTGGTCPASFALSAVSFTLKITDPSNTTGVSATVGPVNLNFTQKGTTCDYDVTIPKITGPAALSFVLAAQKAKDFGTILTTGGLNTVALTATYTSEADVSGEGASLQIKFGGSSAYIIATIL
jgi:hypothetical protein